MQLLLRKLSNDATGAEEYAESELAGETLVFGSAPECDISLLGAGIQRVHAKLEKSGKKVRIVAERDAKLLVNGIAKQEAELKAGDTFEMGGQKFSCFAPPTGFDLGLQWQVAEDDDANLEDAYRTSLDALRFSVRKASWILAILVIIGTAAAPLVHYFMGAKHQADMGAERQANAPVDHHFTPESLWNSGPLLPAHQVAIGNNCMACHEIPFVQVKDQACEACHGKMASHVAASHAKVAEITQFTCHDCHKEHNEPASIVPASDSLCTNCHSHQEPAVKGFSVGRHPEFSLSLLQPIPSAAEAPFSTSWSTKKVATTSNPQETNQLKYPHDLHLDGNKVTHAQRGDKLQCADCHTLSSDGEHFEPIAMETQCSSCHTLAFDGRFPRKQLPHGTAESVYPALEAHYVRLAFEPKDPNAFERRRLPAREDVNDQCDHDYDCAKRQAKRMEEAEFTRQGCVTCHEIRKWTDSVTAPGANNAMFANHWQVLPVKLNRDWYPKARFNHKAHLPSATLNGDALCLSCHKADTSKVSSDILIPDLQLCTSCHGDKAVDNRVPLNCVACHGFHGMEANGEEGLVEGVKDAAH